MALPNTTIKRWLARATAQQKKFLATQAGTSVNHLLHIASGRRSMGADLAQRLSTASQRFTDTTLHLEQRSLCRACQRCPLVTDPLER